MSLVNPPSEARNSSFTSLMGGFHTSALDGDSHLKPRPKPNRVRFPCNLNHHQDLLLPDIKLNSITLDDRDKLKQHQSMLCSEQQSPTMGMSLEAKLESLTVQRDKLNRSVDYCHPNATNKSSVSRGVSITKLNQFATVTSSTSN